MWIDAAHLFLPEKGPKAEVGAPEVALSGRAPNPSRWIMAFTICVRWSPVNDLCVGWGEESKTSRAVTVNPLVVFVQAWTRRASSGVCDARRLRVICRQSRSIESGSQWSEIAEFLAEELTSELMIFNQR